jgi:hypothetical protein
MDERGEGGDWVGAAHIPAGMTGIHIAAKFGNIRVMDVLLANSMSIDMPDEMVPLGSPTKLNETQLHVHYVSSNPTPCAWTCLMKWYASSGTARLWSLGPRLGLQDVKTFRVGFYGRTKLDADELGGVCHVIGRVLSRAGRRCTMHAVLGAIPPSATFWTRKPT